MWCIVKTLAKEYLDWVAQSGARKALRPLRARLREICLSEIQYAMGSNTDPERAATRIVSKLLAQPMTVIKDNNGFDDVEGLSGTLRMLFARDAVELSNQAG